MRIYIVEDDNSRMNWFRKTFSDCEIYYTQNVKTACCDIKNNQYDIIFLDRDLFYGGANEDEKGNELTGEDVARYIKDNGLAKDAAIVIHSLNPIGQKNIKRLLDDYHSQVYTIPFTELKKMSRKDFVVN